MGDSAVISPSSFLNQPRRNRLTLARPKMKKTKSEVKLEQSSAKLRKSNSENRRPPASQDNNMERRRSFRSPASIGEILNVVDINKTTTSEKIVGTQENILKAKVLETQDIESGMDNNENNSECSLDDCNLNQINTDPDKIDFISSPLKGI